MPSTSFKTFSTVSGAQRDLLTKLTSQLGGASAELLGGILEGESREDIISDFEKDFATPVMQIFKREIAPIIREGFNLPGAFFSSSRFKGERRAGEEFLSTRVAPQLFAALESFRNRKLQRSNIFAGLIGTASGLATTQTQQTFGAQKESGLDRFKGITEGLGNIFSIQATKGL